MIKIMQSKDYSMFDLCDFNRNVENTRFLEESMRRHGWIDAYPMHVVQNGNRKFKIKAGHHRFVVAQKLGIPVKFVLAQDSATIHELERSTRTWTVRDYLDSYCRMGKPDYQIVKDYCDETGIPILMAVSMLGGHAARSGNFTTQFKNGTYKVRHSSSHAADVKDVVIALKRYGIKFPSLVLFVGAISKAMFVEEFSADRFKAKARAFPGMFEKKATVDQYVEMIEEIYNRQSREKIPLKFLAEQKAKERNAIGFK
jgi:alpha-glucosidase (family GH31 glycosyl hydrolase)